MAIHLSPAKLQQNAFAYRRAGACITRLPARTALLLIVFAEVSTGHPRITRLPAQTALLLIVFAEVSTGHPRPSAIFQNFPLAKQKKCDTIILPHGDERISTGILHRDKRAAVGYRFKQPQFMKINDKDSKVLLAA